MSASPGLLQVSVENSGSGLVNINQSSLATGKGLLILNELIELYLRLEKVRIRYRFENVRGEGDDITGTRAVITIPRGIPSLK